jgi:hypothetical protein
MSITALWIFVPFFILSLEVVFWRRILITLQKPFKKRAWEDSAKKYSSWNKVAVLLFILFGIGLTFGWHWFLLQIAHKYPSGINGVVYLAYHSDGFLYIPAVLGAILTSPLLIYVLYRILMGPRFAEPMQNVSLSVGTNSWKTLVGWLRGLYLASLLLIFLGSSWYTAFTENAIVVDRVWSPVWIVFPYSQVNHVRLIAYPVDDETNYFYCEVQFLSGDLVRTEGIDRNRLPEYDSLVEFIADKANMPVEKEYHATKN